MKALQDSASVEINRLKEELAILKDQKQAADEQNQCHSEAFKLLQQEKESLAEPSGRLRPTSSVSFLRLVFL